MGGQVRSGAGRGGIEVRNFPQFSAISQSPRREVVRSSAGAYAIYPPFLGSFAYDTPGYGTGCPTPCKIIILGEKMIPQ